MDLWRDFERTNESLCHFAIVLLMHKTRSRTDSSSYVFFWGGGRKEYIFHFVEWKNATLSNVTVALGGCCPLCQSKCWVFCLGLTLWVKGDCKIHKRGFKILRKMYTERERERVKKERKRYIMGRKNEWVTEHYEYI